MFYIYIHIYYIYKYIYIYIYKFFQPCYDTQRYHVLDETGTKIILWKPFFQNVASRGCKFTKKWN